MHATLVVFLVIYSVIYTRPFSSFVNICLLLGLSKACIATISDKHSLDKNDRKSLDILRFIYKDIIIVNTSIVKLPRLNH